MIRLDVTSRQQTEMIAITDDVRRAVGELGIGDGVCHVFVPHTTAAVTINEAADPMVARDVLRVLDRLIPFADPEYRHAEGNSDSHVKTSLFGPGLTLLIHEGRLVLGTWQGVFLAEWDGPRTRRVVARISP